MHQDKLNKYLKVKPAVSVCSQMLDRMHEWISQKKSDACPDLLCFPVLVTDADVACDYTSYPIYPFAFRTHTHHLGEKKQIIF